MIHRNLLSFRGCISNFITSFSFTHADIIATKSPVVARPQTFRRRFPRRAGRPNPKMREYAILFTTQNNYFCLDWKVGVGSLWRGKSGYRYNRNSPKTPVPLTLPGEHGPNHAGRGSTVELRKGFFRCYLRGTGVIGGGANKCGKVMTPMTPDPDLQICDLRHSWLIPSIVRSVLPLNDAFAALMHMTLPIRRWQ